ncbi:RNA exonuclease 4 isoform X2 [Amaranthus tricolor]|uniref:RNA exonuclease 4 isoform X2 n=1 Tax=Amaranthus tricolor TaxID=29722 RepID=UPI002589775E|nr:RNA exonuclease 4 isoform X2 [Amaranthus tricolor]
MVNEVIMKKNPKNLNLNPNWAQLQQKLNIQNSKPKLQGNSLQSDGSSSLTVLGKRKRCPDSASNDSQPNILAPTSSDFSVTDEVGMDCEMVGVSPQGNKSALGRVTLVNKWGNVIYDEFVRPVDRVVDFRTQISGIRPRDLRKAKNFPTVQQKVAELIKGRILVGHALHNDLKALLLSHPKKDLRDTSEYQPFLKESRRKALRHLAVEFLGVQIQNGEHCPKSAPLEHNRNQTVGRQQELDSMQAGNGNQYHCPEISHQTVGKRKESAPKAMPKQMSVEIADPKAEHTSYDIRSSSLTHAIIEATDTTIKNIESN